MPIRTGLFRLSPDYTSCFALLTRDSPKSSHGQFRLVHLIWVCSFNSGYLLLFRPIYLFYIAVGEKNYNQKTSPCLLLFSCSCINNQMIQSFTCIFKIVFKWGRHGRVLPRAAVKFVSGGSLWSERVKRPANYTFLWRCNDDPIKQVTILSTVPRCKEEVLDQRAAACCNADEMRWCEAALREWKREDAVQLNHSCVFRWLI